MVPRPKQTVLSPGEATAEKPADKSEVEKLISLTYDNDPDVRIKAAKQLAELKPDPLAVFGLIELVGDKDARVREFAKSALNIMGGDTAAVSSLEEIFSHKDEIIAEGRSAATVKERLMPSIERLFSYMGEKKAKRMKRMLLPSLERLFSGSRTVHAASAPAPSPAAPLQVSGAIEVHAHKDPLSGIEKISHHLSPAMAEERKPEPATAPKPEEKPVSFFTPGPTPEEVLAEVEKHTPIEETEEYEKASFILDVRENVYRRALDLAVSPGVTPQMLKDEEKRLVDTIKESVKLAFRLALLQAKGRPVDRLLNMRLGMKNMTTEELIVISCEAREFMKGKRPQKLIRTVLSDSSGRMALYLTPQRGSGISVGDKVKLEGAYVDASPFGDESALFISRKGRVIVIK